MFGHCGQFQLGTLQRLCRDEGRGGIGGGHAGEVAWPLRLRPGLGAAPDRGRGLGGGRAAGKWAVGEEGGLGRPEWGVQLGH